MGKKGIVFLFFLFFTFNLSADEVRVESSATAIGSAVASGTAGSVLFVDSNGNLGQDNNNFFWDVANFRLGIGTNTPSEALEVLGNIKGTDAILTDFSDGQETIDEILDDTINKGVLDAITVSDAGGVNISWTAGEIWNENTFAVVETDVAGATANTDDSINFLKWKSGTGLSLETTAPSAHQVAIATINVQDGDIYSIHENKIISERESTLEECLADVFPIIVASGLIVSEHTGANAFDVDCSAGTYHHDLFEKHLVLNIDSTVTNMRRWYHDGSGDWTSDTNSQIDVTQYDTGAGLAAAVANKWYRSVFFIVESDFVSGADTIHWVYPNFSYANVNAAIGGADPVVPSGLNNHPKSTAVIIRQGDAAFPTAGGDRWIDVRPRLEGNVSGTISDHGNLSGLADDDHTQYIKKLGDTTGAMTSDLNLDANTLVIDYDDNEVGIGTATPGQKLHISGGDMIVEDDTPWYGGFDSDTSDGWIWHINTDAVSYPWQGLTLRRVAGTATTPTVSDILMHFNLSDSLGFPLGQLGSYPTLTNAGGIFSLDSPAIIDSNIRIQNLGGQFSLAIGNTNPSSSTGVNNLFIGTGAGANHTSGVNNFLMGTNAGNVLTTAGNNIIIGTLAGDSITTGISNVAMGTEAFDQSTTGEFNFALGEAALGGSGIDPDNNVAIGQNALYFIENDNNVAIGAAAGRWLTTADKNILIGGNAGTGTFGDATGDANIMIGFFTGFPVTSGTGNIIIGESAADSLTSGSENICIGHGAGKTWLDTESDLLVIDNTNTQTPLIYGDFSTDDLIFYGDIAIADDTPHLLHYDTDTSTGYMWHLDEDVGAIPWQGLTLWDVLDSSGTIADPNPIIHVDLSDDVYFPQGDVYIPNTFIADSNIVNLSDTTDEYVLAFDTGTQTWRGVVAAAGAEVNVRLDVQSAKLPATNPAVIDAGNSQWRLLFDDSTSEFARWQFDLDDDYGGGTLYADVYFSMTSGEANEVQFEAYIMAITPGTDDADVDTDSFDTENVGVTTVAATAGRPYIQTITLTNKDNATAGDMIIFKLSTDADDGVNDDATGDREVRLVVIRE